MNVKLVAVIVLSIAILGLLAAPAVVAYSDVLTGMAGGEQKQVKGPTIKASPIPKKVSPTPAVKKAISPTRKATPVATARPAKKQVRMATATPKSVPLHGNVTGVPTTPAGEPMGIGMKNVSATPSRYKGLMPTATARPR